MLMTPLTDQQIEKLMKSDKGNLAERILSSGRIWKFADRLDQSIETGDNPNSRPVPAGMAGAYVLEGEVNPTKSSGTVTGGIVNAHRTQSAAPASLWRPCCSSSPGNGRTTFACPHPMPLRSIPVWIPSRICCFLSNPKS
jgi:hypothetical protein